MQGALPTTGPEFATALWLWGWWFLCREKFVRLLAAVVKADLRGDDEQKTADKAGEEDKEEKEEKEGNEEDEEQKEAEEDAEDGGDDEEAGEEEES